MKKLLAVLAALILLFAAHALAEETLISGDWEYRLLEDGTAEITEYDGSDKTLEIPSDLDGHAVTSIGDHAFFFCDSLTSITIPDSVTSIDINPFMNCEKLINISASSEHEYFEVINGVLFSKPDGRLVCYPGAFTDKEYSIPDGIQAIGKGAFSNCNSLISMTIPESVTVIDKGAFWNCRNLTSVTIPDSVTSIGDYAFLGCSSLTSVTLPDSVTTIGGYAFGGCSKQLVFTLKKGSYAEEYCTKYGYTYQYLPEPEFEYRLLEDGTAEITKYNGEAETLEIPSALDGHAVTSLGDGAFRNCGITAVKIPDSVTNTGVNPFISCAKLTKISVSPDNGSLAVINCVLFSKPDRRVICYPCALTAEEYSIPEGIKAVGSGAFYGCESLVSVTIPVSVTFIDNGAFYGCVDLASAPIPEGVTVIGNRAFYGCESLENVTIPKGVTDIGVGTFQRCRALTSVLIPEGVTAIGDYAFYWCENLTSLTIPGSVTSIGYDAFDYCSEQLVITVDKGSYARDYCAENGYTYQYPDALDWLKD